MSKKKAPEVVEVETSEVKTTKSKHKLPDDVAKMLNFSVTQLKKFEEEDKKAADAVSNEAKEFIKGAKPEVLQEAVNYLIGNAQRQSAKTQVSDYTKNFIATYAMQNDLKVETIKGYDDSTNELLIEE